MECLQTKGSKVIQAKGDADVQIAKAPVTISSFKSITLLGEDIDLFVLLLYHVWETNCTELYLRWCKAKSNVYYIKELGDSAYIDILFLYVFIKWNIKSIVFWIGKKDVVQKYRQERKENQRQIESVLLTKAESEIAEYQCLRCSMQIRKSSWISITICSKRNIVMFNFRHA